jgi:hypothetical protein
MSIDIYMSIDIDDSFMLQQVFWKQNFFTKII